MTESANRASWKWMICAPHSVSQSAKADESRAMGIFSTTTSAVRDASEEEQHHEPGEARADGTFAHEVVDHAHHHGSLVELEVHLHIRRDGLLELGDVRFHQPDDGERGGVGALRSGHIDGAAAVHERVAGGDVALVIHGRHVPHKHSSGGRHAEPG